MVCARLLVFPLVFVLAGLGCQPSQQGALAPDSLTVEGAVSWRGNMPSVAYTDEPAPQEEADTLAPDELSPRMTSALMLETDEGLLYVLALSEEEAALQQAAPGVFRVTGELYADTWNGKTYAHLRVEQWEQIGR